MKRFIPFAASILMMGALLILPACNSLKLPLGPPTATPTPIPLTWTPTLAPTGGTMTPTFTPTPTGTVQICIPTPISVPVGTAGMTYGQVRAYVIRSQANWDSYLGGTGNTPPVDFSTQMVLAVNWGTELCSPGNGMVLNCTITSACVGTSDIQATLVKGSTCTCGGSCVFTDGGNQVVAVVLPASSLPVSIAGVTDIVEN